MSGPDKISVVIPWVPDWKASPNNHAVSERTRIRYRRKGAFDAGYPLKQAATRSGRGSDSAAYIFERPVELDIIVRWPKGRQAWDDDNIVTAFKYVRDALQTFGIVRDDKLVRIGVITQEQATEQPESVLTIRRIAA